MKKIVKKGYFVYDDFFESLPDGGFENGGEVIHRGRNCVKVFDVDGRRMVVKQFRQPNPFNRIIYTFSRGSKALRGYFNALKLKESGINTPEPLAYIDTYANGLLDKSYLVTEYTDYTPVSAIRGMEKFEQVILLDAFMKFTVRLHETGINHKDYNTTNVLFRKTGDFDYEFLLIDVNRMRFGYMSKRMCLMSIRRLCPDPDATYYISQKYAECRGWDKYGCMAGLAILRGVFERRNRTKDGLKTLVKNYARN